MRVLTLPFREWRRFGKFLSVGATSTVLDMAILAWLMHNAWSALPANLLSYSVGILWNFSLNRAWTYADRRGKPAIQQFGQFLTVNLSGLCINTLIVAVLEVILRGVLGASAYVPAKLAATTISFMWNYLVNRLWTFREA